jgi:hypothetical protein
MNAGFRSTKHFKFELLWLKLENFDDAVWDGWNCHPAIVDALEIWLGTFSLGEDRKIGNLKLHIMIANLLILRLDAAQKALKMVGMSSLECMMARQRSRIRWLQDGDANTKLFHFVANCRCMRSFISVIKHGSELITDQERKEGIFFDTYNNLIGKVQNREVSLDLEALGLPDRDLEELSDIFI